MKKKVIIDCDHTMGKPYGEIDDGLTILYLLGRDDIDLLGITNCYANSTIRDVEYWTDRFLHDIDRMDIPRHSGKPFAGQNSSEWFKSTWGYKYTEERPDSPGTSAAAAFLVEQANKYPGEINLLAIGSMTNLQEAWSIDPAFFSKIGLISIMGGIIGTLEYRGRLCRELNLACNPAASHLVLNNGACPVVVMSANVCLQAPFVPADMGLVSFWPERRRQNLREWLGRTEGTFYLWDLLPAVYLSYPELFDQRKMRIASSIQDLEKGALVQGESGSEMLVPEDIVDRGRFMEIVCSAWRKAWDRESADWV